MRHKNKKKKRVKQSFDFVANQEWKSPVMNNYISAIKATKDLFNHYFIQIEGKEHYSECDIKDLYNYKDKIMEMKNDFREKSNNIDISGFIEGFEYFDSNIVKKIDQAYIDTKKNVSLNMNRMSEIIPEKENIKDYCKVNNEMKEYKNILDALSRKDDVLYMNDMISSIDVGMAALQRQ